METIRYRIETRDRFGHWTPDEVGDPNANNFESEAEAEKAIESLRALGDEWETAEYRVVGE